jgi:hypothetical protein
MSDASAQKFFDEIGNPLNYPGVVLRAKARLAAFEQILAPLDLDADTMAGVRKYMTLTAPPYPDWPNLRNMGNTWGVLRQYWEAADKLATALIESGAVS